MDRKQPVNETSESFLERWSRRKHQAEEDPGPLPETGGADPAGLPDTVAADTSLTDADMPTLESLGEDDDYSSFFSDGVSEPLRRAALQRLFRSAKFNVTDGLDDYAEDFTGFAPLGDIVTADMKHRMQQLVNRVVGEEASGDTAQASVAASEHAAEEDAPLAASVEAETGARGTDEVPGR